MKQPIIITNIRMPRSDYLQIKARAGELGVSFNEYINTLAKDSTRRQMMKDTATKPYHKETILEAFDRIAHMPEKPMGWSEEDETIYSI